MLPCSSASTRLVVNTSCRARTPARSRSRSTTSSNHPPISPPASRQALANGAPCLEVLANHMRRISTTRDLSRKKLSMSASSTQKRFLRISPRVAENDDTTSYQLKKLLLATSGALAFSFGYMASNFNSSVEPGGSGPNLGSKFTGGGGRGGGGPGTSSLSVLKTRENAEEDVRRVRSQATKRPYMVSYLSLMYLVVSLKPFLFYVS